MIEAKQKPDNFWRFTVMFITAVFFITLISVITLNEILEEQRISFEKFRDGAECIELHTYLIENIEYSTDLSNIVKDRFSQIETLWELKCK